MITTRIPASTSNLGPGYDCLGIALQLFNEVRVWRVEGDVPHGGELAREAARVFFGEAAMAPFPHGWEVRGEVPRSRGLGSSVTVRMGLLQGLNGLAGRPLHPDVLFKLCAKLEGHPDNAAPAAYGGFTVCGGGEVQRFEVAPALHFVLLVPAFEVSTPVARKVLPPTIDRLDAIRSCANACRITAAFATRDYESLRGAFWDGLHQPFREALVPFLPQVLRAVERSGGIGGFLSGSGSTICAVTLGNAEAIGEAMVRACDSAGARVIITRADNAGVQVSQTETRPTYDTRVPPLA